MRERGYRHMPVTSGDELRGRRLAARPDAGRPDRAGRRAPRPEGRGRRRHRGRRRPRARGLLPLPPVLGGRPRRAPAARGRVAADDRRRAAGRRPPSGTPSSPRSRPLRAIPPRTVDGAARDRRCERAAGRAAHGAVAGRRRSRTAPEHRHRRGSSAAPTRCSSAPSPRRCCPPCTGCATGLDAGAAAGRPRLRRELPVDAHRRRADARARPRGRAVPDLDHRPRLQRIDVHGAGRRVDGRRPRRMRRRRRSGH